MARPTTSPCQPGRGPVWGRHSRSSPIRSGPRIPVWIASLGERNVALTAEIADGWIPMLFVPEKAREVWGASLDAGAARRDPSLGTLQITAGGMVAIGEGEEVRALRNQVRPMIALYVGGMGAKGRNFYNDVVRRYGYEDEAARIQDLYLGGNKRERRGPRTGRAARLDGPVRTERLRGRAASPPSREAGGEPSPGHAHPDRGPATGRRPVHGQGAHRLKPLFGGRSRQRAVPYSSETSSSSRTSSDSRDSSARSESSWRAIDSISSAS